MGKSTNGPGWTDVATFMSALDVLHGGKTGVLITVAGQGHNGAMHIEILTTFDVLPGSTMVKDVRSISSWPCKDCTTLEAHVYGGLYSHDFAIGQAYQQRFLDGVA